MSSHSICRSSADGQLAKHRRTICGTMQRGKSYCPLLPPTPTTIVTTSLTTLAHKNHECEAPRVVPCHAQNLTTQGSGRVMHDELFLEKRECDAGTVLMIFRKAFFVKRSRPHHCHRLTSQPSVHTNTSLGQRSLTRLRGPTSSQEMLGQLWVVVVHIVATPCFIVLVMFWHRSRALHVHNCCFPTVLSGRRGRIAHVLLWFLSLSSSTEIGKLCAGILAQALARCPAQVLQPIRHGFHRDIPNWTTSCDHTKSRHGGAHCPSQRSRPSRHVFMLLPKMNWSASFWWTQHLRSLANMSGENSVPKMSARVNVTSESALLPLWSDCPPRPSSTGAEPTMLQATWREQAHRARTPLRLTCFAAALTGPRGPSLVISFCWTWNQSDVEEKCKCASPSSVRTALK